MSRGFRLEEQSSLFLRDNSLGPSFETAATEFRYPSGEVEPRSEGYDEYFDPPLEGKYECPICLLGLREPVKTSCGSVRAVLYGPYDKVYESLTNISWTP